MEVDEDDNIFISEIPENPMGTVVDGSESPKQIINLVSSDEETDAVPKPLHLPDAAQTTGGMSQTVLNKRNHLESDVIDLDADDRDPFAPFKSVLNSGGTFANGANLNGPFINNVINGMSQVLKDIDGDEGFLGKISNVTGNAQVAKMPTRKKLIKTRRIFRKICFPSQASEGSKAPKVARIFHKPNFVNTANVKPKSIELAVDDSDLPLRKYVLYKPKSDNQKSEFEQSVKNPRPRYTIVNRPGAVTFATAAQRQAMPLSSLAVQEPNFTGFDLNVNINKRSSQVTSSTYTTSTSNSQCSSASQYNVMLGLVLNVNQQGNSSVNPNMNQLGFNNVALDVNVDMGNGCHRDLPNTSTGIDKSNISEYLSFIAKMKSQTTRHWVQKKIKMTPSLQSGDIHKEQTYQCSTCFLESLSLRSLQLLECRNPTLRGGSKEKIRTIYSCGLCSYDSMSYCQLMKHVYECAREYTSKVSTKSDISEIINNYDVTIAETIKKSSLILPKPPDQIYSRTYCCASCSWKTPSLNLINTHKCPLNMSQGSQLRQQIFCCAVCEFKSSDIRAFTYHVCPNTNALDCTPGKSKSATVRLQNRLQEENSEEPVEMYSCLKCSYQCTNIDAMRAHKCVSSNRANILHKQESNNTTKQRQVIPLNKLNAKSERERLIKLYSCSKCSYKSTQLEQVMNNHKCNPTENKSYAKEATSMFHCVDCFYESDEPDDQKNHKCPYKQSPNEAEASSSSMNNDVSTRESESESDISSANFSCLACSFRTPDVVLANAHKCQNNPLMNNASVSPLSKPGYCQICGSNYLNSSDLFVHVMETHFSIKKLWVCGLCPSTKYFHSAKDLLTHYVLEHEEPYPGGFGDKIVYKCIFCNSVMQDRLVNEHFETHIRQYGNMIKSIMFEANFANFFKRIQDTQSQYPPVQENENNKEHLSCYFCKQTVTTCGIKCVNSFCENWFHIECCDKYSQQLDPSEINNLPDWFCVECNEKSEGNLPSTTEHVENVQYCLEIADTLLLSEVANQNGMIEEIRRIKDEKLSTSHEFRRIKDFIINAKSEKINNLMVKGVCDILENFLNAGVGDANS